MMFRMTLLMLIAVLVSGCLPYEAKKAQRRAQAYGERKGEEGDPVGAAVGAEMEANNKITGADKVPVEEVPLEVPSIEQNIIALNEIHRFRQAVKTWLKKAASTVTEQLPWVGGVITLAGSLGVAVRKLLKARKAVKASHELFNEVKNAAADKKLTLDEFKNIMSLAKNKGPHLVNGAKELYQSYMKWKEKKGLTEFNRTVDASEPEV